MNLTDEQRAVVEAEAGRIKVVALAGTGKSTTLKHFAAARPGERMLYAAFNAAVARETGATFPRNVQARTWHSLAFGAVGRHYKHKLGNLRARELEEIGIEGLDYRDSFVRYRAMKHAIDTAGAFFQSAAREIGPEHLPVELTDPSRGMDVDGVIKNEYVVAAAEILVKRMLDPEDPMPIPHDGYLHEWAMGSPELPFDRILLDEAQDTNPVCLHVLLNQRRAKSVFVGDPYQAIYAWRGAVDAMSAEADAVLPLTGSFRFDDRVASWGNLVLEWIEAPAGLRLRGLARHTGIETETAAVTRTNSALFSYAADLVQAKGRRAVIEFLGGIRGYRMEEIEDAYQFWKGERPRRGLLKLFPDFDEFSSYADVTDDNELKARVRIVEKYKDSLPRLLHQIRSAAARTGRADLVLSTCHKAKGQEWANVMMGDDFQKLFDEEGEPISFPDELARSAHPERVREEANLLYVAATRAKIRLSPSEELQRFRELRDEREQAGARPA